MSQGSISEPLLSDIFLNDFFLFVSNSSFSNYDDENTVYTSGNNLNAGKCHFMYLGNNVENETFLFNKKHS